MSEQTNRRLLETALVSLNGIASTPHRWVGEHFGPDSTAKSLAQLRDCDAMLMGRGCGVRGQGVEGRSRP